MSLPAVAGSRHSSTKSSWFGITRLVFRMIVYNMPKVKVSTLKQSPYGFARWGERIDPTRQGVQKAIEEGRFSKKIMDQHYKNDVAGEIQKKTQDPAERDRLMHEYHNERVAELVRTKDIWLDKPEAWPIKVNQLDWLRWKLPSSKRTTPAQGICCPRFGSDDELHFCEG